MDSYKDTKFENKKVDVQEYKKDRSFIMKPDVKALRDVDSKKITIIFTEFKGLSRHGRETEAKLKSENVQSERSLNVLS